MAYQSEIEKLQRRYDEKPEQWFAALADAYRKAGELDVALEIVRSGIAERPNYVSGHIVLGRCLVDEGHDDEAKGVFEQVLVLDAENIIALKVLGEVAERAGDLGAARQWLDRLLEVDPMNDEARVSLDRVVEAIEAEAASPPLQPTQGHDLEAPSAEGAEADATAAVVSAAPEGGESPPGDEAAPPPTEAPDIAPPTAAAAGEAPPDFQVVSLSPPDNEPGILDTMGEADVPTEPVVSGLESGQGESADSPGAPSDAGDEFVIVRQSDPFEAPDLSPPGEAAPVANQGESQDDADANIWGTMGTEPELATVPDADSIRAGVEAGSSSDFGLDEAKEQSVDVGAPGAEAAPPAEVEGGAAAAVEAPAVKDETTDEIPALTLDAISQREKAEALERDADAPVLEGEPPSEGGPRPIAETEPQGSDGVPESLPEYNVDAPPPAPAEAHLATEEPPVAEDASPAEEVPFAEAAPPAEAAPYSEEAPPYEMAVPSGEEPVDSPAPEPAVDLTDQGESAATWSSVEEPADEPEAVTAAEESTSSMWLDSQPTTPEGSDSPGGDLDVVSLGEPQEASAEPTTSPVDEAALEAAVEPVPSVEVPEPPFVQESPDVGMEERAEAPSEEQVAPPTWETADEVESPAGAVSEALPYESDFVAEELEPVSEEGTPVPEESEPAPDEAQDGVLTETMAEVYASQGLIHQAREVYEALLRSDPSNAAIRLRLAELDAGAPEAPGVTPAEEGPVAPAYSASATGGLPVRTFLQDLLIARPVSSREPAFGVSAAEPTPLEEAFEEEPAEASSGAPTVPAGDEMSLASVFGEEAPVEPTPEPAEPGAPEEEKPDTAADMSFDEFFGTAPKKGEPQEAASDEESEEDDEDFKAWLKSLKS